ncbi:TPA: antiterminator [Klebsiella pneumoniae]|uniref:bacteriophage antitermination protein Q n=1 Tax=Klebsiella pneumoniae TaxID=573 RepID=UPI0013CF8BD5|nr:bacteriophage antitermination protein Q [Klebsiella pneumoniae]EKV4533692.1 antiterminator [Klebsiella pneumoniae]MDN4883802.1 bacteriophage antitermination protein Q [Klebsiella pneumoniae]MDN4887784.1 bacteriophage antitermination protein Q [Klebsiella pneumoniae]MDN4942229.1 bacteriophage antitermination protein Q [Klebsiella pneumoniae]NEY58261.1 antiterminator [Klebsiella pneumoniae]
MNTQYLQYVRQQLIVATADLSGATKGQLVAFAENAQFTATARSRGRKKVADPVTGRMVNPSSPPIPGQQSRAKGSSIALVLPVEYSTASWRRALLSLEEHQKSWLLWNYSENIRFEHQVAITQWAWAEFRGQLGAKKVAGKTMERLKKLTWLAAQDVKAELAGRETYEYQALAELVGVAKSTWTETYLPHWLALRSSFVKLDSDSLISVTRSRSQQKATNLDVSLAKPN